MADPETYEVLYANKHFKDLLGENPVGKKCYEAFQNFKHPCDFCTNQKILKNKGEPYEWEYHNPVLNKNFMITDRIIKWHDGRDVRFEFAIDITELKKIKNEIKDLSKFPSESPYPVIRVNKKRLLYANKAARNFLKSLDKINKSPPKVMQKSINEALKLKKIKQVEIDQGNKTFLFSIVPISNSDYLNIYGMDITKEVVARNAFEISEERYRLAQRAAGVGSWDWDISKDIITWSDQIEPLFGFKKGEFKKTYEAFLECVHPDDRQFVIDSVNDSLEKGEEYNIEHRIVWPDDSIHWVEETGDVIRDKKGKPVRMLGIVQDITEWKNTAEKIKKLNENLLKHAAELATVNKELEAFSYSVSHDLRAPLRSIDGFSQALLEDYEDELDEEGKDYLKRIINATQQMGLIIDELLKLSRITRRPLDEEKVNIANLSKSIIEKLKKQNPKRRVKINIDADLTTRGDKQLIQMALENLIGNAWKFTSKKKNAEIKVGKTKKDGKDAFFVKDNGAGFDMKYVDKLFIPFQRLHKDDEFEGTGIGLGIVSRIIHRHGGEIWADAEEGKGATFYFTLKGDK